MTDREHIQRGRPELQVKIGDREECLRALSAAVAKKAYEIYQRRGCVPGCEREDWQLAEHEVLRSLSCCGMVDSKDQMDICLLSSGLGSDGIEKIEVCIESRRVIFIGKRGPSASPKEGTTVYRVLPLEEEVDPLTARLTQRGDLFEIKLRKVRKELEARSRAA